MYSFMLFRIRILAILTCLALVLTARVQAQTTSTSAITGSPFCAGASVSVTFTTTGGFNAGNVFTAQLSDASGGFGSPVSIGSLSGPTAGTIAATIPATQTAGTGYRIRVVSTSPTSIVTTPNGANLTVNALGIGTPTPSATTICQGGSITVNYTLSNACAFPSGNSFTAQLSDAAGSFSSPVNIGSVSSTTASPITATIPVGTAAGTGYKVRVVSSNPSINSAANTANITINALGIGTPTVSATTVCQGANLTVNYALSSSCAFPSGNTFTVQLSNSAGSFTSPTDIGSVASSTATSIVANIPTSIPAGSGYRVRVVSSNPSITSAANTANITINAIGLNAPTFTGTTFCQGGSFTLNYTLINSCGFLAGNTFTAELSSQFGSFAAPVVIGTATATGAGNFTVTIPANTTPGNAYRIRLVGSTPSITSLDNGSNLTINALGISAPVFTNTSFCQGEQFNLTYTVLNSCNFPNSPANTFTAQLSDASGSFASPVTIGTRSGNNSGTITAVIPAGTTPGTGYRVRVISSNPSPSGLISPDNGTNLTVLAPAGDPTIFGNGAWNVYVYNSTTFANYSGFYTENNVNFNTTSRFVSTSSPSTADGSSGSAYTGCYVTPGTWSMSMKRANFTCGYYQIDIPTHDDGVTLFIDGTQVFNHSVCCDAHTNVWTGFLGPASKVEFQVVNSGSAGYLSANFTAGANPLTVSPPVTICSGANTTLSVSTTGSPLSYAWTPTTGLTPTTGASVTAQPFSTTTYTVTGTDAASTCSVSKSTLVTVSSTFTPVISASATTICSGIVTSTLTASGANTYSWSPSTGLSATTGYQVIANPPSTTTYTVTASNGCATKTANVTVNVQTIPSSPSPSGFGNNTWNVYCHNNTTFNNYYGYYTENNLSFNTGTRWNSNSGPTVANASSGLAYSGCAFGGTQYSMSYKRTNFTCGYYQIDIPNHDDIVTLFIDGVQIFNHNTCCDAHTNIWTGFLGPTSQVEFQLVNFNGPGLLQVSITPSSNTPIVSSPSVTICSGSKAYLESSSALAGATFSWTNSAGTTALIDTPNNNNTTAGPLTANETYTVTLTDAATTGCTKTATVPVIVNPLPNTSVSPTTASTYCPGTPFTLTATGANTYSWSPSTGLSATSGFQVVASPTVTTTYTVTGNNNCGTKDATVTITINPLVSPTVFPSGTWNVYGYNTMTFTGYQGFYTENGSGSTGYDFNTNTRWASGAAPSTATASNGQGWLGCDMPGTNISLSFKRTGFACGIYQVSIPFHDDAVTMYVNGVSVASHNGCCDVHTNLWTGVLTTTSQVEFRLAQGTGASGLNVTFVPLPQPAGSTAWIGGISTDWFNSANWCNGVPTSTKDAYIYNAGTSFQPVIGNTGAEVKSITIAGAVASGTYNSAIPGATLTTTGTNGLNVYDSWLNSGTYTANNGTISFLGSNTGSTIVDVFPTTFYTIVLNKTSPITNTTGIIQVSNLMTFTSGVLVQNAAVNILAGAGVTGASNTSYVDGQITKTGNTAFTFPTGKGGLYRPISISGPALATDNFTAQYFNSSPLSTYPNSSRDNTLDHISNAEYWILNRSGGTSAVSVSLSWDSNSGGVGNLANLAVARWDLSQGKWKDQGNNGAPTGNTSKGTVTSSTTVSTFSVPTSVFTLGTTTNANVLPVRLSSFTCSCSQGVATLQWITATELNSDRFEIERTSTGVSYESIGEEAGNGTSAQAHRYQFRDDSPSAGSSYYRLKQVDYDGKVSYSELCHIENDGSAQVKVYPNPATDFVNIELSEVELSAVKVWNAAGEIVYVPYSTSDNKIVLNTSEQKSGLYVVELVAVNGGMQRFKVIVTR